MQHAAAPARVVCAAANRFWTKHLAIVRATRWRACQIYSLPDAAREAWRDVRYLCDFVHAAPRGGQTSLAPAEEANEQIGLF